MRDAIQAALKGLEKEIIGFAQQLVQIPSVSGNEEEAASLVIERMHKLGYDQVIVDRLGGVFGIIGKGPLRIMYDSHLDTVDAGDVNAWSYGPYSGLIRHGRLYGRGSADMKGAVAATVYAGHLIKSLGLHGDKTVIVSVSVLEEDYDGASLHDFCSQGETRPDCVVICEPSSLNLAVSQRGRAMVKITTPGVSAHASNPGAGINAVYAMQPVVKKVEELSRRLGRSETSGSLALTQIESRSVSLNAIPDACTVYLDRRLTHNEGKGRIEDEISELIKDTGADWEIIRLQGAGYTGEEVSLSAFFPGWKIGSDHPLTEACAGAYQEITGRPPEYIHWEFSTNGVATAGLFNIPTIGFGPGDFRLAHAVDEFCPLEDILTATQFYAFMPEFIASEPVLGSSLIP